MNKFAEIESAVMALADACLVRMAEEMHGSRVFTVDSDFHVYRMRGRKAVPLICPN
jgi:predicted nucleic acid-binding protein